MTLTHWIPGLLLASALVFAGCGKSNKVEPTDSAVLAVDATNFRPAFASASPETKTIVDNVMMSIQASLYPDALVGLDKLAALPDLSEAQKKVVADMKDQVKKKLAAPAP